MPLSFLANYRPFRRERFQDYKGWLLIPELFCIGVKKYSLRIWLGVVGVFVTLNTYDFDRRRKVTGIKIQLLPNWNRKSGESLWKYNLDVVI